VRYAFGGTVDFTSGSCGIASCFPDGVFVARMKKVFDGIRTGKHDVGGGTRRVETRARARRTPRDPPDTPARARRAGGVRMCARGQMSEDFPDFTEETKTMDKSKTETELSVQKYHSFPRDVRNS
jgi:hypothetical protein